MARNIQRNGELHIPGGSALASVVRKGVEGWCIMCNQRITAHMDTRGNWLGCSGSAAPADVPYLLVPDLGQLTAAFRKQLGPIVGMNRRVTDLVQNAPKTHEVAPGTTIAARVALPPTGQVRISGPQVAYFARYPVTAPQIQRLPPHDRKVYGLIARKRKAGATRKGLMEAMRTKRTGQVDGAVRRLRLRHVITVRQLEPTE